MIAAIQIAIFVAAFFVPDEIPAVDEILMVAAAARAFYVKKQHNDGQDLTNEPSCIKISGANDDNLSGGDE